MRYLSGEDILIIHARIIDKTSGSHGIRDIGLLKSIVERPKTAFGGKDMFESVFIKAAVYIESIAQYRVFIDGNKRTSIAVSARFLYINGQKLTAPNKDLEIFVLHIATKKLDLKQIALWLKSYSKKAKQ